MYPFIEITQSIKLPTYLVIISSIYCVGLFWITSRAEKLKFNRNMALDLCLAIMLGGFLGARLLHVIYEAPEYYLSNPKAIYEVWRGGFVFFGGFIGALVATELVFRKYKSPRGPWHDFFTPVFPIGYAVGRLSCLAAGCCYGRPTDLPWGISFPPGVEAPAHINLHPTQLYAFVYEMILFATILYIEKNRAKMKDFLKIPGALLYLWFFLHAAGRITMESFRADERGPALLNLSISSWISLTVLLVSGYLLIYRTQEVKNAS